MSSGTGYDINYYTIVRNTKHFFKLERFTNILTIHFLKIFRGEEMYVELYDRKLDSRFLFKSSNKSTIFVYFIETIHSSVLNSIKYLLNPLCRRLCYVEVYLVEPHRSVPDDLKVNQSYRRCVEIYL